MIAYNGDNYTIYITVEYI